MIEKTKAANAPVMEAEDAFLLYESYGFPIELTKEISAEHGIGTLKREWLGHARAPEEIALMRLIKNAIDPKALLNPGKVL